MTIKSKLHLFYVLLVVVFFTLFLIFNYIFKEFVVLDHAKFLEEFAKSIVAVLIISITQTVITIRENAKIDQEAKAFKSYLKKFIEGQIGLFQKFTLVPEFLEQILSIEKLKEYNLNRDKFLKNLNELQKDISQLINVFNTLNVEVMNKNIEYLNILLNIERSINGFFSNEEEIHLKNLPPLIKELITKVGLSLN